MSLDYIQEVELKKFNPYHDSRGRFTTAGNASSFTIRTRGGAYQQGMVDRAIQREKYNNINADFTSRVNGRGYKMPKLNNAKAESDREKALKAVDDYLVPKTRKHQNFNYKKYDAQMKVYLDETDAEVWRKRAGTKKLKALTTFTGAVTKEQRLKNEADARNRKLKEDAHHRAAMKKTEKYKAWSDYEQYLKNKYKTNRMGPNNEYLYKMTKEEKKKLDELYDAIVTQDKSGRWRVAKSDVEHIEEVEVEKFNPYHGSRGRFTTAGNATSFDILKSDDDKHLVFGWASIVQTADGETVEDIQKDIIEPEDLEDAAYEYVLNFRDTGEEHLAGYRKKGKLIESCVFTEEKQRAMGLAPGSLPIGWWIGFHIEDDDAWRRIKDGTYKMFSIEGKAERVPVEKNDDVEKFNPYHDAKGRFASSNSTTSFTYKPGASVAHDKAIEREREKESRIDGGASKLTKENEDYLRDYTAGKYHNACAISQEIMETGDCKKYKKVLKMIFRTAEKETLSKDIEQSKQLMDAINNQPVKNEELVRIETGHANIKQGDTVTWGIRSTSRDVNFGDRVKNESVDGMEDKVLFDGQYAGMTEYRIVGPNKRLDIDKYSDFDQQESLVCGKFRVKSVKKEKYIPPKAPKTLGERMKDEPELAERFTVFTSKKGREMIKDKKTGKIHEKNILNKALKDDDTFDYANSFVSSTPPPSFKPKTIVELEQIL